jgi:hypothetical protein
LADGQARAEREALQLALDHAAHDGAGERIEIAFQAAALGDKLVPVASQLSQLFAFNLRDMRAKLGERRLHAARDHCRVERVGFGAPPQGAGEESHLCGVEHMHDQPRLRQATRDRFS